MAAPRCLQAVDWPRGERLALHVTLALALMLPLLAVALAADVRTLDTGESVWLKPMRFCLAFGVHLLTMVWIGRLCGAQRLQDPAFASGLWLQAATVVVELACIVLQAARGQHSHFNYASPFDRAVFTVMGIGTAVTLAGLLLCAWGVMRSARHRFVARLLLASLALATLGGLVGVVMVMPTAEQRTLLEAGQRLAWIGGSQVGSTSGRTLPLFGWDLSGGDWRAAHFTGLHALQAVPLLAWLAARAGAAAAEWARRWAAGGALAYAGLFLAVVGWTVQGRSVLAVGQPGWWALGLPSLVFAGCAFALACLSAGGRRRVAG